MDGELQETYDEVVALKRLLQEMLLPGKDGEPTASPPASSVSSTSMPPMKETVVNDCLLEIMGVSPSESPSDAHSESSQAGDDGRNAVSPLPTQQQQQQQQQHLQSPQDVIPVQHSCLSNCLCQHVPRVVVGFPEREEQLKPETYGKETRPHGSAHSSTRRTSRQGVTTQKSTEIRASKTSAAYSRRNVNFEPEFHTRMEQFVQKNQQKEESIRQSLAEKEATTPRAMPTINRRSKRISRDISHLLAWQTDKESRLSRLRAAETARQDAACVGKPSISQRSAALFAKRQDEVAHCKVEDRLQLLGLIYQYQQQERTRAQEKLSSISVHPNLAPHSVNVRRRKRQSAHERLYQLAKRREVRTDTRREDKVRRSGGERQQELEIARDGHFAATVERLCSMGEQYKQRRDLLSEQHEQYLDSLHQMPKISERSRKLAIKKKREATKTAADQLRVCRCCGEKEDKEGKCHCTLQSRVDRKQAAAIYEKHLQWKCEQDAKHSQQRKLQEAKTLDECTFRNPYYKKAWDAMDANVRVSSEGKGDPNAAFFARCMRWAAQRDRQVALEKKASQEMQLQECTFRPKIISRAPAHPGHNRVHSSQSPNASTADAEVSMSRFLDCSSTSSPRLDPTDELFSRLYSALDLEALAAQSSPDRTSSVCSGEDEEQGYPKYSFTDLGEFAGR